MSYPSAAVANVLIDTAAENGFCLTNLKLQKMVYFAHGWYLAFTGNPLINEPVQSWQYGPVVQPLYNALRHYGASPITRRIKTTAEVEPKSEDWQFIRTVYKKYAPFSPAQLVAMTHQKGSPWEQFGAGQNNFQPIPNDVIKNDFMRRMTNNGL